MTERDYELDWDSEIENESPDFILLPEGDYDFTISHYERARHEGSDKLPPCNKAIVYFNIETPQGTATIKHNFFLHSKTEGILCSFFCCIGQRKHGEKVSMNWPTVPGSTGKIHVTVREFTGKNGETVKINNISKFYDKENYEADRTAKLAGAGFTEMPQQQSFGSFGGFSGGFGR